ncbi:MAG: hypothetical protein AAB865_01935 [Patescibacteria group bacterium]
MNDEMAPNSTPETPKQKGAGWLWVALIVIVVAGVLYLTQQKAPSDSESTNTATETPEVKDIPVTPSLVNKPTGVPAGSLFGLEWKVDAAEQTFASETGLAWDMTSHPGPISTDVAPNASAYPNTTKGYQNGLFEVPGSFEDNLKLEESAGGQAMYLRVFATVAGHTYWSDEISIGVKVKNATGGGS